jgi:hypothetical protein
MVGLAGVDLAKEKKKKRQKKDPPSKARAELLRVQMATEEGA